MPTDTPVPYETLVRFGVIGRRLNEMAQELYAIDTELGGWITEQLGFDKVEDHDFDRVCNEFNDAVDARFESEDGDAS